MITEVGDEHRWYVVTGQAGTRRYLEGTYTDLHLVAFTPHHASHPVNRSLAYNILILTVRRPPAYGDFSYEFRKLD